MKTSEQSKNDVLNGVNKKKKKITVSISCWADHNRLLNGLGDDDVIKINSIFNRSKVTEPADMKNKKQKSILFFCFLVIAGLGVGDRSGWGWRN